MSGAVYEVITHGNFCENWLRDFGVAMGRILAFSINLLRRLYNTLALPCECVISTSICQFVRSVHYVGTLNGLNVLVPCKRKRFQLAPEKHLQ